MKKGVVLLSCLLIVELFLPKAFAVLGLQAGGLSIAPHEEPGKKPPYRPWFLYHARPGDVFQEKVDVTNISDELKVVFIHPVDAGLTVDGGFTLKENEDQQLFVGKWMTVEQSKLTLEAKQDRAVNMTIQIPPDVEEGEYWGGVTVIAQYDENFVGIKQVYRVGARAVFRIKKDGPSGLFGKPYPDFDAKIVKGLPPLPASSPTEFATASVLNQGTSEAPQEQIREEEKTGFSRSFFFAIGIIVILLFVLLTFRGGKKRFRIHLWMLLLFFAFLFSPEVYAAGLTIKPHDEFQGEKVYRSWLMYPSLKQGDEIHDAVRIINLDDTPATAIIRAVDAETTSDGGFGLGPEDEPPKGVGAWITLEKNEVDMEGKQELVIPFVLKVPVNVEPGDHTGGIVVLARTSSRSAPGQKALDVVTRVGLRIYSTIQGERVLSLQYDDPEFQWENGKAEFLWNIKNKGNLKVQPIIAVTIMSKISKKVITTIHVPSNTELLPGDSAEVPIVWENPSRGWFTADFSLQYQDQKDQKMISFQTFSFLELSLILAGGLLIIVLLVFGIRFVKHHVKLVENA